MKTFTAQDYIPSGMSLGIFHSVLTREVPAHKHEFLEFVYVNAGSARHLINDMSYSVVRGDLLFINYGSTHVITNASQDFEFYNVCFDLNLITERILNRDNAFDLLSLTAINELRGGDGSGGKITFYGKERVLIEALLADMLAEFVGNGREKRAVLESYMTVLAAKITRKLHPCQKIETSHLNMWEQLSEYIAENLNKKLTLEGMAKQCFYNPSYFSRAFKERFGTTLVDYISRERAGLAAKLLAETDMTIEKIAEECGYGDKSSLYRSFARLYGKTPSDYRAESKM